MKDVIRKELIKIRSNLSELEMMRKSNLIKNRLFEILEFKHAQSILFYVSYDNEVYTHDIIKESLSIGKQVVVPKSNTDNNTLVLSELTGWEDLELGSYDILEPKSESIKEIPIESIDVMLVPGVVFDEKGNRIGHGKGYYDRLLKKFDKLSIGLAFEFQLIDEASVDEHDVKVDKIVTEKRVIQCSK